jgi:hypothetical protein
MVRILLIVTFAANVVLTLTSWVILPDTVAIHFGRNGLPDGWAPVWFHALLFLGIELLLFATVFFGPRLSLGLSPRWTNLPNKDYWLKEENLPRARAILSPLMWEFGSALFVFLFVVGVLTLDANLSTPVRLREEFFWPLLILFMVFMVYWCIRLLLAFRLPKAAL